MLNLLTLFFALNLANVWSTEVRTENGFRYSMGEIDGRRWVQELDAATSSEKRLIQLEELVFLRYPGTRTLCADQAGVSRTATTEKCIRVLERILNDETQDWTLLSGIYLNETERIPHHLQDPSEPARDVFGFVWLAYDFAPQDLAVVAAKLKSRRQIQIDDEKLLSAEMGRKISFQCHDKIENCRRILRHLSMLDPGAKGYLRESEWISTVQVWPELKQMPRIAPNGSFSQYQLNLASSDDLGSIEHVLLENSLRN